MCWGRSLTLRFTICINSPTVQTLRIQVPWRGFRRSMPKASIEGPTEPSACMEDQSFKQRAKGGMREDDEGLLNRRPCRSLRANTTDAALRAFWGTFGGPFLEDLWAEIKRVLGRRPFGWTQWPDKLNQRSTRAHLEKAGVNIKVSLALVTVCSRWLGIL